MNTVLRTMWPYYNYAVGQQVLEQANPIIAEQIKQVCPLIKQAFSMAGSCKTLMVTALALRRFIV